MHDFKVNDFVKWKQQGIETVGKIKSINKATATVMMGWYLEKRVPFEKLTYLPPLEIGEDGFRAMIRLDCDILAVVGNNDVENIKNVDGYKITVEDVVCALQKMLQKESLEECVSDWCLLVWNEINIHKEDDNEGIYTEREVVEVLHMAVCDSLGVFNKERLSERLKEALIFIEDKNKPFDERRYPLYVKENLLEKLQRSEVMAAASEGEIILYRKFAKELAAVDNEIGLNAVGYGCYSGDRAFECDWNRSRNCLTKLFQITEDATKKAFVANSLGYIYYYGRCNGGIPEYEKAYEYFSFAAFNKVYEAQYKIADMFQGGKGVVKSWDTAKIIIMDLYEENIKYVREGHFDCKFADVALRMGGLFADSETENEEDYYTALYYYTQAEFAIRMRMMETNYYGDARVCDSITQAIAKMKEKLAFKPRKTTYYGCIERLIGEHLSNGEKLDVLIDKKGENKYKMTFTVHEGVREGGAKRLFITAPEIGMCGLYSKLTITFEPHDAIPEQLLGKPITFDEIGYSGVYNDGKFLFDSDGRCTLKNNAKKDKKTYRFASVSFGGSKLYDYLCDESIAVNDRVIVNALGETKEVVVCRVFEKEESELSLPLKAYKKILKKV